MEKQAALGPSLTRSVLSLTACHHFIFPGDCEVGPAEKCLTGVLIPKGSVEKDLQLFCLIMGEKKRKNESNNLVIYFD